MATVIFAASNSDSDDARLRTYMALFFVLTIATNLAATLLIGFRIWNVHRKTTPYRISQHLAPCSRAIRVIFGAGLLYASTILILLATFFARHKSQIIIGRAV